ncbi:MAG: sulfur carrier protein ThiS adenylyltransferase ThiF [Rectinema sp.]
MGLGRNEMRAVFAKARVGIAGAGGLGSNCAAALVRSGIGALVVVDFDVVSEANLDRQFYFHDQVGRPKVEALAENLARIDRKVEVEAHNAMLAPSSICALFSGCDVVVEAFDSAEAKEMLIETVLGAMPGTPVVAASGLAGVGGFGRLRVIRRDDLTLCGDFESGIAPDMPPVAPRVAIVAGMEADAVLELLLERARKP